MIHSDGGSGNGSGSRTSDEWRSPAPGSAEEADSAADLAVSAAVMSGEVEPVVGFGVLDALAGEQHEQCLLGPRPHSAVTASRVVASARSRAVPRSVSRRAGCRAAT